LAIGLGVVFRSMLFSGFRLMHVNTGDTRLVNFILEHSYRWVLAWLSLHPISLWNQPFFFPTANVGAYSEILLGSAPIYWLFRVAQFAPDTSFQLWMMAVLTLDYFAMIVFLRNCLGFRAFSSTVGALLFAFASPRLAQMDHQQLLPQFFTVFALYGLFRFFRPARMSSAQGIHLFFLGSVLQLWAGFYLGWFLFFGVLVLAVWALSLSRHRTPLLQRLCAHRRSVMLAAGVSILVAAPMAYHYGTALREVGSRPFWAEGQTIPPQAWWYLGPLSWIYSWQERIGWFVGMPYENEKRLGLGWISMVLATLGFYRFERKHRSWSSLAALSALTAILLMTLYPGGFTPWEYLSRVIPGATAVRSVSRLGLWILIPLSIGLAYLVETARRPAVAFLIAAIAFLEQGQNIPGYDKLEIRRDVSAIAARVTKGCGAFYYAAAYARNKENLAPVYKLQIDAMWASLETGVPTVNGYSGNFPKGWWELVDNRVFDDSSRSRLRDTLERWSRSHRLDPARVCWIETP